MRNFVITIARQYGSGGREIGQLVSEKLGYEFYDKNLITMAAQKSGLSSEQLSHVDETASNSLLYTLALGSSIYNRGYDSINLPINDRLFVLQSGIIKEVAESGKGAVIVGRCADSVLEGFPNIVRVFISGGFSKRVETIMSRHSLTEQEAKDITIKTDRRR